MASRMRWAVVSGAMSLMNTPMPDSVPARYLSLSRRGGWRRSPAAVGTGSGPRSRGRAPGARRRCRKWPVEEPVEPAEQVGVQLREGVAFGVVERGQVGDVAVRVDVHLHRPSGGLGHERGPVLVLQHPRAAPSVRRTGCHRTGRRGLLAVGAGRGHHVGRAGGDERQRVDLTVRVVQGHPDLLAPILEAVHLLDAGQFGERGAAVGPGVDDGAHPGAAQLCHRGVVVGGEAENLAASLVSTERREAVLERDHVVVGGGDLGVPIGGGGAQRALVAGGRWVRLWRCAATTTCSRSGDPRRSSDPGPARAGREGRGARGARLRIRRSR